MDAWHQPCLNVDKPVNTFTKQGNRVPGKDAAVALRMKTRQGVASSRTVLRSIPFVKHWMFIVFCVASNTESHF